MTFEQYFCEIDGYVCSIVVDLSLRDRAPVRSRPYLLRVRIQMQAPREDGLSSNEEAPVLGAIEQALEQALAGAIFAGRYTLNRCRHLIFYCEDAAQVDAVEPVFLWNFKDHKYTAFVEEDPEWETYAGFLYPDALALVSIENRRRCLELESAGMDLTRPMMLEHEIATEDGEALSGVARSKGFTTTRNNGASVFLARTDTPSYEEIDLVTQPLVRLTAEFGGEYRGWKLYQSTTEPSSSSNLGE